MPLTLAAKELKNEVIYVRIKRKDLEEMRRQALLSRSLLQRIRDLEKLYKDTRKIVESIYGAVEFVKEFLHIEDLDIFDPDSHSENEFEHISGVVMSPGFVEFSVKVTDADEFFEDVLSSNFLEFDIYYNKQLFKIDHLEGDKIFGDEYRKISLSSKTSGAKDRLKVPVSDLLSKEMTFKLFLAPRNPNLIKVGDKTNLDIRYYKRVNKNEDGLRIAPIQYAFTESSARNIEVVVK